MVNTVPRHTMHHAFTMMELIFAIVIIALVSLTIPSILMTNARQTENNLLHEAILIAATQMGQTLSYPWDERSREPDLTLATTDVLNVTNGDVALDRNGITDFRVGHFQEALRRRMTPDSVARNASTTLGRSVDANTTLFDDVDDVADLNLTLNPPTSAELLGQGYKMTYTVTGAVNYVSDTASYNSKAISDFNYSTTSPVGTTNIKMVEIRVDGSDAPNKPDIIFRAFTSNIGETDYYKRTYE